MMPIGGYFELERGPYAPLHDGILTNSGCSALRLIVRALKIKRIHAPAYTCPVVHQTLKSEGCEIELYDLDSRLLPSRTFPKDDFILANDYFGLTGGNIAHLAADYPNLIVDNAQSYFASPRGRAAFYSPRKFMGVPDGGIAVFNRDDLSSQLATLNLSADVSYDRMSHLLKRHDLGATVAYDDFRRNEEDLFTRPLLGMSHLTQAIISSINPENVRARRLANFSYLFNRFKTDFPVCLLPESVPLVYPCLAENGDVIRKKLIASQIFCPTYWPGSSYPYPSSSTFNSLSLVCLPIDQRYDELDMKRVLKGIQP